MDSYAEIMNAILHPCSIWNGIFVSSTSDDEIVKLVLLIFNYQPFQSHDHSNCKVQLLHITLQKLRILQNILHNRIGIKKLKLRLKTFLAYHVPFGLSINNDKVIITVQ